MSVPLRVSQQRRVEAGRGGARGQVAEVQRHLIITIIIIIIIIFTIIIRIIILTSSMFLTATRFFLARSGSTARIT